MICPNCGAEIDENLKFCVYCGAELKNSEEASGDRAGKTEESSTVKKISELNENTHTNGIAADASIEKPSEITVKQESSFGVGNVIGIIVGIVFIIVGAYRIYTAGTSISPTSFGGDFYTYTYRGIVAISEILAEIELTLGWIVVAIGAAIDVIAIRH